MSNHSHRRSKLIRLAGKKAGLAPGTLVHVGEKFAERVRIAVMDYDETRFGEKKDATEEECLQYRETSTRTWIDVSALHEVGVVEALGKGFVVHPLVMEDVLHADQRPKFEDFGDYLFIVFKMLDYDDKTDEVTSEQVSLVVRKDAVLSFQEKPGDVFDPVRERLRAGKGRIRTMGADYLAYALLDAVVDRYFLILEKLGERIERLENEMTANPGPEAVRDLHRLKHEMLFLRKAVWPLREVVNGLERSESPLIEASTRPYLRDVYDHTIQVMDTVETYRDMLAAQLDIYLSSVNNRTNEIMKILTAFAAIFMPLTFIVGIYGMNFHNMPEIAWRWGYAATWGVMLLTGGALWWYFKRKRWL